MATTTWKDPVPGIPVHRRGFTEGHDGVPIHFTSYGEGGPAIVCCNGVGVSTFFWKYVVGHFGGKHRVVTWDYRGHAQSGMPAEIEGENFTIAGNARDLERVLDAVEVERGVLLGHSMGCQVIFEFWRQFPDRVAGLVPVCGPYGSPLDTFFLPPPVAMPLFDTMRTLVTSFPEEVAGVLRPVLRSGLPLQLAKTGLINAQLAKGDDMLPYFEHLSEIDLRVFFLMADQMQKHSATEWLDRIDAPTLVVAGEDDLFTPMSPSEEMCRRISGAELLNLPRGSHAALIEHPELLNLRLEKFLRERVARDQPRRAIPTRSRRPAARRRA